MGAKRLILHIGYSKCGSTTIQDTLTRNYQKLLENDILYPKVLSESPSWLRFFWEPNLPVTYPKDRVKRKFDDFVTKLQREVNSSQAQTVILSDEGLISLSASGVGVLKQFLSSLFKGYKIEVVCIVREPISFFTSRCQQFISDRYFDSNSIRDFIEGKNILNGEYRSDCYAMNPGWFLSKNIKKYEDNFENIALFEFEEAISDPKGITCFFLTKLGFEITCTDIRSNESRSNKAIDVIAYINSKMPFRVDSGQWKHRKYRDLSIFYNFSGEKYVLPNELKNIISEKGESEIQWLKKNYNISYSGKVPQNSIVKINWDEKFYKEAIGIFPRLPLHLKIFFKSFLEKKLQDVESSSLNSGIILTNSWIEKEYPLIKFFQDSFGLRWVRLLSFTKRPVNRVKPFLRRCYLSLFRCVKGCRNKF